METDTRGRDVSPSAARGLFDLLPPCATWRILRDSCRQITMNEKSHHGKSPSPGARESAVAYGAGISLDQVRRGLPIRALDQLARQLQVDRSFLANVLGVSLRTLQRKAGENQRLSAAASDRLARVRRILDLATEVLGAQEKGVRWLSSKSRALDGEVPLQMLDTDMGTQRVQQELHQIEFGFPF